MLFLMFILVVSVNGANHKPDESYNYLNEDDSTQILKGLKEFYDNLNRLREHPLSPLRSSPSTPKAGDSAPNMKWLTEFYAYLSNPQLLSSPSVDSTPLSRKRAEIKEVVDTLKDIMGNRILEGHLAHPDRKVFNINKPTIPTTKETEASVPTTEMFDTNSTQYFDSSTTVIVLTKDTDSTTTTTEVDSDSTARTIELESDSTSATTEFETNSTTQYESTTKANIGFLTVRETVSDASSNEIDSNSDQFDSLPTIKVFTSQATDSTFGIMTQKLHRYFKTENQDSGNLDYMDLNKGVPILRDEYDPLYITTIDIVSITKDLNSTYTIPVLTGRSKTPRTTPTTRTRRSRTTPFNIDIAHLMAVISNLTMSYQDELALLLNKSLEQFTAATCPTPPRPTTTETPTTIMYQNLTGTIMGKCFVCGLIQPNIPNTTFCADAFSTDFVALIPVEPTAKSKVGSFRKYCRWMNIPGFRMNASDPRAMYGRWTGGCSVRWVDVSGVYTQRTCRNRHRAIVGRSYVSRPMAKLEMALQHVDNGCIITPVASLVPFSRAVSLYARYHACVCTGSWCNRSTWSMQWTPYMQFLTLLLWTISQ